jgi:hypothetical protein
MPDFRAGIKAGATNTQFGIKKMAAANPTLPGLNIAGTSFPWDLQAMFEPWTGLPPLWVVRAMRRSQALQLARSLLPPEVSEKPRE